MPTKARLAQASAAMIVILLGGFASARVASAQTISQRNNGIVRASPLQGAKEAYLPIIRKESHAANLLAIPNGDLLCFWFTGAQEGNSGVSIAMSRLNHGANSWSLPVIISHHPGWSDQNPVPFLAPNGRLWLFHTSQKAHNGQTTAIVYQLVSEDQGRTWTVPKVLFPKPGTFIRQHLVVFHREWLFPTYRSASSGITTNAQHDVSIVKLSNDNGKTWRACEVPRSGGLVQMNIIKLSHHRLIAFFRSRYADWIYKSDSTDGCHWSPPVASQLPNNNSSIQAARLRDGHLVTAFNNAQAGVARATPRTAARNILSVALSVDEGKTWPWVRDVQDQSPTSQSDEDAEYSYPSVTQSPNGAIQMAFTSRRETIKYMTFNERWIEQGTTTGVFTGNKNPARARHARR